VDADARADRALVPARRTHKLIRELVNDGYTKRFLARQLGYTGQGLPFSRPSITARNASRIERLYRLIEQGRVSR
jgi:hypothetical protein